MSNHEELRKKYEADHKKAVRPQTEQYIDNPSFFHDSDSIGNVLTQAREAVANSQELQSRLNHLRESLTQAEQSAAEAQYEHELRSQLQPKTQSSEGLTETLKTRWHGLHEELRKETDALREQLQTHQAEVSELKEQVDASGSDEANVSSDIADAIEEMSDDAEQMQVQLDEANERQASVEAVVESGESTTTVISRHEWRFLTTGYVNVVEGRLKQIPLDHPVTGEHYPPEAWTIKRDRRGNQLEATLGKKWLRQAAFRVKAVVPTPSVEGDGFIFQPVGVEWLEWMQNETQDVTGNAYLGLAVASPTGFTDDLQTYVRQLYAPNASVFLIDLHEGQLVYNGDDAMSDELAHLMAPEPIDKQLAPLRDGLEEILASKSRVTLEEVSDKLEAPPALLATVFREFRDKPEFDLYLEGDQAPQEALLYRV